jgi:hypothetical protein
VVRSLEAGGEGGGDVFGNFYAIFRLRKAQSFMQIKSRPDYFQPLITTPFLDHSVVEIFIFVKLMG